MPEIVKHVLFAAKTTAQRSSETENRQPERNQERWMDGLTPVPDQTAMAATSDLSHWRKPVRSAHKNDAHRAAYLLGCISSSIEGIVTRPFDHLSQTHYPSV